ncbi:MAG TPA: hypothetical protein VLE20_12510 [Blastocatellia bacterium]|jgi:hypothetical protein|nr:hypothetical protein [Blastocatellia bacterium]
MNSQRDETGESTSGNNRLESNLREERKELQETLTGDLEPRADIRGGSLPGIHKVTDVTLKRGSGG